MTDQTHHVTPGFEFPTSAQDKIEETLRGLNQKTEPVRSIRPDRQHSTATAVIPQIEGSQAVWAQPQTQAQAQAPQIAVAQPNTVKTRQAQATPMASSEMVSIDLPSRFAYYKFKDLYVKPFRALHLAKLAKADHDMSMQLIVETVSSVLATPQGHTNIGFELTIPDLNAVMYWLRMHSFTRQTIRVTSQCENHEHIKAVNERKVDKESLVIETQVDSTMVEIKFLDTMPDPEYFKLTISDEEGQSVVIPLRPETARDAIAFLDHPDFQDPEFQYKIKLLSLMDFETAMPNVQWTVERKIQFFDEGHLSPDDVLLINEFAKLLDSYGVSEQVPTRCGKCGASGTALLSFDATSFLAPAF